MISIRHIPTLLVLFCIYTAHPVSAQMESGKQKSSQRWSDRLYTGGNFGLQFGNSTVIDVNPIVGYKFTPKLSSGIGIKYLYFRYKDPIYNYSYESNIYGGSLFSRYEILDGVFGYTEYEVLNLSAYDYATRSERRIDVGSWFVGAGYSQRLGVRSSVYLMLLYNLTESRFSPYDNPLFRMGFGIGI